MKALTIIAIAVALVVAVTAVAVIATDVTYEYCTDAACAPGTCQKQTLTSGTCYGVQNQKSSVTLTCSNAPQMCSRASFYSDSKCTETAERLDSVCNSCGGSGSQRVQVACGALFDATFVVSCSDAACQNCQAPTIVPYKQCKLVSAANKYATVFSPVSCNAVSFNLYQNSTDCTGTAIPALFWSGVEHCNGGQIFSCSGNSSSSSTNNAKTVVGGKIKLPEQVLKMLKF